MLLKAFNFPLKSITSGFVILNRPTADLPTTLQCNCSTINRIRRFAENLSLLDTWCYSRLKQGSSKERGGDGVILG